MIVYIKLHRSNGIKLIYAAADRGGGYFLGGAPFKDGSSHNVPLSDFVWMLLAGDVKQQDRAEQSRDTHLKVFTWGFRRIAFVLKDNLANVFKWKNNTEWTNLTHAL